MVKIRLSLHGAKKKPFYKIVVTDSRFPRNGRFIEQVGFFDPKIKEKSKNTTINIDRINFWIKNGANLSNRVKKLIHIYSK